MPVLPVRFRQMRPRPVHRKEGARAGAFGWSPVQVLAVAGLGASRATRTEGVFAFARGLTGVPATQAARADTLALGSPPPSRKKRTDQGAGQ